MYNYLGLLHGIFLYKNTSASNSECESNAISILETESEQRELSQEQVKAACCLYEHSFEQSPQKLGGGPQVSPLQPAPSTLAYEQCKGAPQAPAARPPT